MYQCLIEQSSIILLVLIECFTTKCKNMKMLMCLKNKKIKKDASASSNKLH